jgi:hypothetical protein
MAQELKTEEQIRKYVEAEVRAVRLEYPEVALFDLPPSSQGPSSNLAWEVGQSNSDEYYGLEARPDQREFVVFYGHRICGSDPPVSFSPLFPHAVHVYFPGAWPDTLSEGLRAAASLRSALLMMLSDRDTYPMNWISLT